VAELQALDAAWQFTGRCGDCVDEPADAAYPWRGMATGDVAPPPGYEPTDFRIPTLAEVATTFPDMPLDIEIKGTPETGALATAAALATELEELGRVDTAVVVSFSTPVVAAFHELAPDVAVSPGLDELVDWYFNDGLLAPHYRIIQIPPEYSGVQVLDASAIAAAAAAGVVVWVWPSDRNQENEATYRQWIELGVNGIISGDPASMTAAVDATGSSATEEGSPAGGSSQSGGQ
jgi:glycerophosphoryl diester phosphodiesterase